MKRAILLVGLAAVGVVLSANPGRAASQEPCQPSRALVEPCQVTPPCPPQATPCHRGEG